MALLMNSPPCWIGKIDKWFCEADFYNMHQWVIFTSTLSIPLLYLITIRFIIRQSLLSCTTAAFQLAFQQNDQMRTQP
jgi:hypothetical protein